MCYKKSFMYSISPALNHMTEKKQYEHDLPFLFSFHSSGLLWHSLIQVSSKYSTSSPSFLWKNIINRE